MTAAQTSRLARILKARKGCAINLGSYSYTPVNTSMTRWRSSDGATFRCSLGGIVRRFAESWMLREIHELLDNEDDEAIVNEYIRVAPKDQEQHEARNLGY